MSEFYQVVKIDGKGLGCVATKDIKRGTLILREKAPIVFKQSEMMTKNWAKSVLTSFKQMSKKNQEEFLKLHNPYWEEKLSSNKQMYESLDERDAAILAICAANVMPHSDGLAFVPIHASRFNHSCSPTAGVCHKTGTHSTILGQLYRAPLKSLYVVW